MKHRMRTAAVVAALLLAPALLPAGRSAGAAHLPETIELPEGFTGEGVATAPGGTVFAGKRVGGRIAIGDLDDGTTRVLVSAPLLTAATGLKADVRHGLLWVAGASTGSAAVYDLETGAPVERLDFTGPGSFINDVVVTRDAAYFTNSLVPEIYRVPVSPTGEIGEPETIDLRDGPAGQYVAGFNLNGIDATRDGRTLVSVNSTTGQLFAIDPTTGGSAEIMYSGGPVTTGDGILLLGRDLLVLRNGGATAAVPNEIVVVRLDGPLTSGEIVERVTSPWFESATTIARSGAMLVAVNAQFAPARHDPEPELVLLPVP